VKYIIYKTFQEGRELKHPSFVRKAGIVKQKFEIEPQLHLCVVEDETEIDVSLEPLKNHVQIITKEEVSTLLKDKKVENKYQLEDDGKIKFIRERPVQTWNKQQMRLQLKMIERVNFDNYEEYISKLNKTEDEKKSMLAIMKTIHIDYAVTDTFKTDDPNLKEMLDYLESIGILGLNRSNEILKG
jgi:hypothetical protein